MTAAARKRRPVERGPAEWKDHSVPPHPPNLGGNHRGRRRRGQRHAQQRLFLPLRHRRRGRRCRRDKTGLRGPETLEHPWGEPCWAGGLLPPDAANGGGGRRFLAGTAAVAVTGAAGCTAEVAEGAWAEAVAAGRRAPGRAPTTPGGRTAARCPGAKTARKDWKIGCGSRAGVSKVNRDTNQVDGAYIRGREERVKELDKTRGAFPLTNVLGNGSRAGYVAVWGVVQRSGHPLREDLDRQAFEYQTL